MSISPPACPSTCDRYVVQPGDTYYAVARQFGVSVASIQSSNPGIEPNNLIVGQIICVPTAKCPQPV